MYLNFVCGTKDLSIHIIHFYDLPLLTLVSCACATNSLFQRTLFLWTDGILCLFNSVCLKEGCSGYLKILLFLFYSFYDNTWMRSSVFSGATIRGNFPSAPSFETLNEVLLPEVKLFSN